MNDRTSTEAEVFGAADGIESWPTGRLLSTAARLVERAWQGSLEQVGLTHQGLVALDHLGACPLSQSKLARLARAETQNMSRTLERLERDGYIARVPAPDDARRRVVTRTPEGVAIWEKAKHMEENMFPPTRETDALRRALLEIIAASPAARW